MARLLAKKTDVTSIMLRNTSLDDSRLEQVSNSLVRNNKLRYVNINCNNITANGVRHIITILKNNPFVDSLALVNCVFVNCLFCCLTCAYVIVSCT